MPTLHDLEQSAWEDFKSSFHEGEWDTDDDEAYDIISEIADRRVPVYTSEILEVAMSDLWLVCGSPEIYNSNCKFTPLELITSNIYEHLQSRLLERYHKNKID